MIFFIVSLAIWRITHLVSKEDGPFNIIYRLRRLAGSGFFGELMDCFYCCSIWISLPFALGTAEGWKDRLLYWMAYSGLACLLEKLTEKQGIV